MSSTCDPNVQDKRLLSEAADAMWNNDCAKAEHILQDLSETDARFALALSEVHWANSILSGSEAMLTKTLGRLNAAMNLAKKELEEAKNDNNHRHRNKDKTTESKKNVRKTQIILADANFLAAATMVALGQKLNGAWNMRKAWKLYLATLQSKREESADECLSRLFSADRPPVEEEEARAMFGVGACLVALSWLPQGTVTTILAQLAGFTLGRRKEGLKMLERVAQSTNASMRSPLAYTVLLLDILFMPHGIRNSRERRDVAARLIKKTLERWPRCPTFHWMAAAEARKAGRTASAIQHIDEATHECLATGEFESVPQALTVEKATLLVLTMMFDGAVLLSNQCLDSMIRSSSSSSSSSSQSQQKAGDEPNRHNLYQVRCEITLAQAHAFMNEDEQALKVIKEALDRHKKRRNDTIIDRDKGLLGVLQMARTRTTGALLPPYELLVITRDAAHLSSTDARAFLSKLQSRFLQFRSSVTEAENLIYRLICGSLRKASVYSYQDGPRYSELSLQSDADEAKHDLEFVASIASRRSTAAHLPYCVAALAYYELADIASYQSDVTDAREFLKKAVKCLSLPCLSSNAQLVNTEIIAPRVKNALEDFSS